MTLTHFFLLEARFVSLENKFESRKMQGLERINKKVDAIFFFVFEDKKKWKTPATKTFVINNRRGTRYMCRQKLMRIYFHFVNMDIE